MKTLKWTAFFILSFLFSWAVIATFSQPEFALTAPIKIALYTTPEFAIFIYIISAFFFGLLIGLSAAMYNFISNKFASGKNARYVRELEAEINRLKIQLGEVEPQTDTVRENFSGLVAAKETNGTREKE